MTELPANYPEDALLPGTELNGYTIQGVLGRGTFGITYLAEEMHLERDVAIKEYLPEMAATRDAGSQVIAKQGELGELFHQQLASFLEEAKTLVKFNHPNIVRVLTYFPALGTAYLVMEYEVGMDLNQYLKTHTCPSELALLGIFSPIVQGLAKVHASGYIHRDIKAANIYIREDSSPVLLDFGAARNVISSDVNQLTRILTVGYAPYEQDNPSWSEQGPWTDIYALAATLYACITGKRPVSSTIRAGAILGGQEDPYISIMSLRPAGYSLKFLSAIDKALRFDPKERPQTTLAWDAMLKESEAEQTVLDATVYSDNLSLTETPPAVDNSSSEKLLEKKSTKIVPALFGLIVIGGASYLYLSSNTSTQDETRLRDHEVDAVSVLEKESLTVLEPPNEVVTEELPKPELTTEITNDLPATPELSAEVVAESAEPETPTETVTALNSAPNTSTEAIDEQAIESELSMATGSSASLEQSKSTMLSTLLLGKTAAWHFARSEKIADLIAQIKLLPATADRTRFIVDQENKKRQSDEGFTTNLSDYEVAIGQLRQFKQSDIEAAMQELFSQERYRADQTYRTLGQLIKEHASAKHLEPDAIESDLKDLSRSSAFVDS